MVATKRMTRRLLAALVLANAMAGLATVAAAETTGYTVTLYESAAAEPLFSGPVDFEPPPGYAVVHERRVNQVGEGRGTLTLNGFPRYLDPGALVVGLERGRVLSHRFDA